MNLNQECIANTYKNAQLALTSIETLLKEPLKPEMDNELRKQKKGYESFISEIKDYMAYNDIPAKDENAAKVFMLKSSIKMKTMSDTTSSHVADMMLKGTIMGITELRQLLSRSKDKLTQETEDLIIKLLSLEEEYEKRLKKLL